MFILKLASLVKNQLDSIIANALISFLFIFLFMIAHKAER